MYEEEILSAQNLSTKYDAVDAEVVTALSCSGSASTLWYQIIPITRRGDARF